MSRTIWYFILVEDNLRKTLEDIFYSAIDAVNPYKLIMQQGKLLRQDSFVKNHSKLYAVSFGKAAYNMSKGFEDILGMSISKGIAIAPYSLHGQDPLSHFNLYLASHPIPDERGFMATQQVVELLQSADEETLVVILMSGGGSALLVAPFGYVSLHDKQVMTKVLLEAGANINEINTVRKHISAVKGGRLAEIAAPARVISLILSDVPGDDVGVIASGPTAPDSSTYSDALSVIKNMHVEDKTPDSVLKTLTLGKTGIFKETPKQNEGVFDKVRNIVIGSNSTAIHAAQHKASSLGYQTRELLTPIRGEAKEAAIELARTALDIQHEMRQVGGSPICLISGGETTVTVNGSGNGGRNTEFALAFALAIDGIAGVSLLSAGTDGIDGPTDAAGAFTDGSIAGLARKKGLDPKYFLNNNDSYTFFKNLNTLLTIGPTGTNVADLQIIIVE